MRAFRPPEFAARTPFGPVSRRRRSGRPALVAPAGGRVGLRRSQVLVVTTPPSGPATVQARARFGMLGNDVTTIDTWHYAFAREPSPTKADLRAVLVTQTGAIAFGDGGTILVRGGGGAWALAPSPTHERLRGASNVGVVVGDHGTWLMERNGQWIPQSSATDEDLYAVTGFASRTFAVGNHGVLIERSPEGRFFRVEART